MIGRTTSALMRQNLYTRMDDIFPDDHYVGRPLFVDPELHVNEDLAPGPLDTLREEQEYRIETEEMFKERTKR